MQFLPLVVLPLLFAQSPLAPYAAGAADIVALDFSPSPMARFDKELDALRAKNGIVASNLAEGEVIAVRFARADARAQDRWLDGEVEISGAVSRCREDRGGAFSNGRDAARRPRDGHANAAARGAPLGSAVGKTFPRAGGGHAHDRRQNARRGRSVCLGCERTGAGGGQRIPIQLDVPSGTDGAQPLALNFGVPFAAGALWSTDDLRLVDGQGRELPAQKEVTGRGARDGAIQWFRFDTVAAPAGGIFVEHGTSAIAQPPKVLTVQEKDGRVMVDTGLAGYTLARGASPLEEIRIGAATAARSAGTRGLFVIDQNGRTASASAKDETVETNHGAPSRRVCGSRAIPGRRWRARGAAHAGPHLSYRGIYPEEKRYHWATDALRPGLWKPRSPVQR